MDDLIREQFVLALDILAAMGAAAPKLLLGGIIVGLLLSWTVTQRLKRYEMTRREVELLAFAIASLFTFAISTEGFVSLGWLEAGISIVVGCAAPLAYKALMAVAKWRQWQWALSLSRED